MILPFCQSHSIVTQRFLEKFSRNFSRKLYSGGAISKSLIKNIDLTKNKIIQYVPKIDQTQQLPIKVKWDKPTPVTIKINTTVNQPNGVNYYCGGLPALMQAAWQLERLPKNSQEQIVYVNDGKIPKTLLSGHQAHVHPSEWSSEECSTINLIKTMLRGMGFLSQLSPSDLKHYSYLHFPFSFTTFRNHPIATLSLYSQFFKERIVHTINAENGLSEADHWLCKAISQSLDFHKELSNRIEKQQGSPSFVQLGRVCWSPDQKKIEYKEKIWKELGIKCRFMSKEEVKKKTLLRIDHQLSILYIPNDGKFLPQTPLRIERYLQENFPCNFQSYCSSLQELHLKEKTYQPISIQECLPNQEIQTRPVKRFFASLGHNQVFFAKGPKKPLWIEVPVSGISSLWKCTIKKRILEERLEREINRENVTQVLQDLLPSANLSNLHVTMWEGLIERSNIVMYIRVSQGANFNSLIADKNDLMNMLENLNTFFIGSWDLISVGTCSRKTHFSNIPEVVELSSNKEYFTTFLHGSSGIGYSFSGTPPEMMRAGF